MYPVLTLAPQIGHFVNLSIVPTNPLMDRQERSVDATAHKGRVLLDGYVL